MQKTDTLEDRKKSIQKENSIISKISNFPFFFLVFPSFFCWYLSFLSLQNSKKIFTSNQSFPERIKDINDGHKRYALIFIEFLRSLEILKYPDIQNLKSNSIFFKLWET